MVVFFFKFLFLFKKEAIAIFADALSPIFVFVSFSSRNQYVAMLVASFQELVQEL